jgi:hypothetical protein
MQRLPFQNLNPFVYSLPRKILMSLPTYAEVFLFIYFFAVLGFELGLAFARQVLYHMSHATSPMFFSFYA